MMRDIPARYATGFLGDSLAMKASFTRFCAYTQIALGVLVIIVGVIAAGITLFADPSYVQYRKAGIEGMMRGLTATAIFVGAFILAAPLIVTGQLCLVFLDIRLRLARLDRRTARWDDELPPRESRAAERLIPGR